MSRENVELLVGAIEAFNRLIRSFEPADFDRWVAFFDPEIRFEPQQSALQGVYVSHAGLRRWVADLSEHYGPGGQIEPVEEVRDVGDRVLAFGRLRYTGRGSGIETETVVAIVARFRDGRIVEFRDHGDRQAALEAVGLRE